MIYAWKLIFKLYDEFRKMSVLGNKFESAIYIGRQYLSNIALLVHFIFSWTSSV